MVGQKNIISRLDRHLEIMKSYEFGSLEYKKAEDIFTGLLETSHSSILSDDLKREYEMKYFEIV